MKPEEDAYGQALLHYLRSWSSQYIVERSDGYIDILETGTYFQSYEEWSKYEKEAMKYVKGRILDLGCGAGRHALYLQNKDFDVLGTDISPLAIEVCKERGLKNAEVVSIDDTHYEANSFDTILMMGNNFGLFGNFGKARSLLKIFHYMTSKDAVILACSNDVYKTSYPLHLEYQESNRKRGRISGQINMRVRFRQYATHWYDYLMVSQEEMEDILKGTGWKIQRIIESEIFYYVAILDKESVIEI